MPRSHALTFLLAPAALVAQNVVTLQSVTLDANDNVTVVYSKNFATCAHMHFSNATCSQNGALTHAQNHFCASGTNVAVTVPWSAFAAGFGPGATVYLVHGNDATVFSACVTVGCDGAYGAGCAGTAGVPTLDAGDECPAAASTCAFALTGGLPASLAVLAVGLGQGSFPVFGCNLLLGSLLGTATVPFDGLGNGAFAMPIPAGAAGFVFTAQAFTLDPGGPQGFAATNGLLVRVL